MSFVVTIYFLVIEQLRHLLEHYVRPKGETKFLLTNSINAEQWNQPWTNLFMQCCFNSSSAHIVKLLGIDGYKEWSKEKKNLKCYQVLYLALFQSNIGICNKCVQSFFSFFPLLHHWQDKRHPPAASMSSSHAARAGFYPAAAALRQAVLLGLLHKSNLITSLPTTMPNE